MQICGCGCGCEAKVVVKSFDYDPKAESYLGNYFETPACQMAAQYLIESAAELGFPCDVEPV